MCVGREEGREVGGGFKHAGSCLRHGNQWYNAARQAQVVLQLANENDRNPGNSRAASSPPSRIICKCKASRGFPPFTDSREHERHNALMSLISLPTCHFAPPWALSLCLPVGSAVCSNVCLPVFPVTESVETSQRHSFYPNLASAWEQVMCACTHSHIQTCI